MVCFFLPSSSSGPVREGPDARARGVRPPLLRDGLQQGALLQHQLRARAQRTRTDAGETEGGGPGTSSCLFHVGSLDKGGVVLARGGSLEVLECRLVCFMSALLTRVASSSLVEEVWRSWNVVLSVHVDAVDRKSRILFHCQCSTLIFVPIKKKKKRQQKLPPKKKKKKKRENRPCPLFHVWKMERNTEADLPPLLLLHLLLVQQNTDKWITGCPTGNGGMQKRKLARNAHTLRIHVSARFGADLHARSVAYRQKLLRPELRRKFVRSARCRLGEWINLPGPHACPPSTVSCLHNGVGLTPPPPPPFKWSISVGG